MGYATIGKNERFTGTVYTEITPAVEMWHKDNGFLYIEIAGDRLPNVGTEDGPDFGAPTAEELKDAKVKVLEAAIDDFIDETALGRGYKTKTAPPATACLAYAGFANPYQAEAIAFGQWKASIWPIVFQIQMDYEAAVLLDPTTPEPTLESIMAALPVMAWP